MSEPPKVNPKTFAKLFAASDTLQRLKGDPDTLTVRQYGSALTRVCESLTDALNKDLKGIIYAVRDTVDPAGRELAGGIVQDAQSFAEFLRFEREVLVACGVSEKSAEDTVTAIRKSARQICRLSIHPGGNRRGGYENNGRGLRFGRPSQNHARPKAGFSPVDAEYVDHIGYRGGRCNNCRGDWWGWP